MVAEIKELADNKLPWLVVGKGPSSDRLSELDLAGFNVVSLNHACLVAEPVIAHFVDVEAIRDCLPFLRTCKAKICMPWRPHVRFVAGKKVLTDYDFVQEQPWRFIGYNSGLTGRQLWHASLSTLELRRFGSTAVFSALALAGVSTIHSIGIDGGTSYGSVFNTKDKLANGQPSFDTQKPILQLICRKHKVTWVRI